MSAQSKQPTAEEPRGLGNLRGLRAGFLDRLDEEPRGFNIKDARRLISRAILEAGTSVDHRGGRSFGVEARWQAWLRENEGASS